MTPLLAMGVTLGRAVYRHKNIFDFEPRSIMSDASNRRWTPLRFRARLWSRAGQTVRGAS
jgi:hypothetical protein